MPDLIESHQPTATADVEPKKILSSEIIRAKPSLKALGIGFSVSYAKKRMKAGKPKKLPYFACRYNVGNLGNVNIVAFHYPLIADWDLMEKDAEAYRVRIRSAIREEILTGGAQVEDRRNVRVTNARRRAGFTDKTKPRRFITEISLTDDFQCHWATQIDIERFVSDAHRAPTQLDRFPVFALHQLVVVKALGWLYGLQLEFIRSR
jgi:hypothetical protein